MAFVTGYDFREASGDGYFILAQSYGKIMEHWGMDRSISRRMISTSFTKELTFCFSLNIFLPKKQCAKDLASCISMLRKANTLGWEESEDTKNEIVEKIAEQIRTCREFLLPNRTYEMQSQIHPCRCWKYKAV